MIRFDYSLLDANKKTYLGFSCGSDSVVCAHFLLKFRKKLDITLIHVNNHLEHDYIAVNDAIRFAKDFGYKLEIIDAPITPNGSIEDICRKARIKAFSSYKGQIIVCHHLGDAVESYLFNCFRGHSEYLPIPLKTQIPNTELIRPFILTEKSAINRYALEHDIQGYINNDPLNKDSMRGWMRNNLMPVLDEKFNGIDKVVKKIYLSRKHETT